VSFWHVVMGIYGGASAALPTGFASAVFSSRRPEVIFGGEIVMGAISFLSTLAAELGTYAITATFEDEVGNPMTPTILTWSLVRTDGTIINSRQDVPIAASASVTIVLQGADLAIFAEDNRKRRVVIEGTYTSSLGSGLPLKAESEFSICDLVGVP